MFDFLLKQEKPSNPRHMISVNVRCTCRFCATCSPQRVLLLFHKVCFDLASELTRNLYDEYLVGISIDYWITNLNAAFQISLPTMCHF